MALDFFAMLSQGRVEFSGQDCSGRWETGAIPKWTCHTVFARLTGSLPVVFGDSVLLCQKVFLLYTI